jgi:hypothetical protein
LTNIFNANNHWADVLFPTPARVLGYVDAGGGGRDGSASTIDAVVRVQAADEDSARKVIPAVLGAPGTADWNPAKV